MQNDSTTRRLIAVFAFFAVVAFGLGASAQQMWTTGATMPGTGSQVVAVTGNDGMIYIFGGFDGFQRTLQFDPTTGMYQTRANIPTGIRGGCGDVLSDGRIVIVGGFDSGHVSETQIYDPATDTWTAGAEHDSGWECAAVTGHDGNIHLFGGEEAPTQYAVYDPAADSWTDMPDMPRGRKTHGVYYDGVTDRYYVFGGANALTSLDIYDPNAGTWSNGADLLFSSNQFGWAGSGGKIWVVGGSSSGINDSAPYYDDVWEYDIAGDTWTEFTDVLPGGLKETDATIGPFGELHVFGGSGGSPGVFHFVTTDTPGAGCGNNVVDPMEECDDGVNNSDTMPDACRTDCTNPSCGDGVVDTGEGCDDGMNNSDTVADACRTTCMPAACGDGVLDTGEECDDGMNNSDIASNTCRTSCVNPFCGDDVVDSGEECDDGMNNSDTDPDACRPMCVAPTCGDGVVDSGESCDDGMMNSDTDPDTCRTTCALPECGDGVVDTGEDCDGGPDCESDCTTAGANNGMNNANNGGTNNGANNGGTNNGTNGDDDDDDGGGVDPGKADGGCGCATGSAPHVPGVLLALVGLFVLRRRGQ